MGLIDDAMATDAAFAFMDSDTFAEAVTYLPATGGSRSINAVVFRDPPETPGENPGGNTLMRMVEVYVYNDTTSGIGAAELNLGGDKITVTDRLGKTAENLSIKQIVSQDNGVLRLKIG